MNILKYNWDEGNNVFWTPNKAATLAYNISVQLYNIAHTTTQLQDLSSSPVYRLTDLSLILLEQV